MNAAARSTVLILASSAIIAAAGCSGGSGPAIPATPTIYLITSTLPASPTQRPSATPAPPTIAPTSAPVAGVTTSQLNIRSGPSMAADTIGSVGIFSQVEITGKDASGSWYRIVHTQAPGGVGWITAAYVQLEGNPEIDVVEGGTQNTPIAEPAEPAGTAAPRGSPVSPVSTRAAFVAAPIDSDSQDAPAVDVAFTNSGTRSFQWSDDVSWPEGDSEDWLRFSPAAAVGAPATVSVLIDCDGSSDLQMTLLQNGAALQRWEDIQCAQRSRIVLSLFGGPPYMLQFQTGRSDSGLNYVGYTVVVESSG